MLVAPDKFKGTLSAAHVAEVIGDAVARAIPESAVARVPLADGGEGTVALALQHGFAERRTSVAGPLGDNVTVSYAVRGATAVIESSQAAGLSQLSTAPDDSSALAAGTFGVGQVLLKALRGGATDLVLGLGGSATTDGGLGLALALGAVVTDATGRELMGSGGGALCSAGAVDLTPLQRWFHGAKVTVASDVDNPLLGPGGAAAVYGPQKGASPAAVETLNRNLGRWVQLLETWSGRRLRDLPGAGAAGGMALPLLAATDARMQPGVDVAVALSGVGGAIRDADVVIVGEGSLDAQSLRGKGPLGLARLAKQHSALVVAVVGVNRLTQVEAETAGVDLVYALADLEPDLDRCRADASELLERVANRVGEDLGLEVLR